jgi:F0F1-type ATP synthase epsilon subunit
MTSLTPLTLRVLSPEGIILEVNGATSINVPLVDGGGIGIRPGHAPLIAETAQGHIRYLTANEENQIEIMPGVLEISENIVTILTVCEFGEMPEETGSSQNAEFSRLIQAISQELYSQKENALDGAD